MESKKSLLKLSSIDIVPNLTLKIPTVGEILDDEKTYYSITSSLTASPFQYMVQLDDMGIDYTSIDEWELFRMLFLNYCNQELVYKMKIKELEIEMKKHLTTSDDYLQCKNQIEILNSQIRENGFNIIFKDFHLTSEVDGKLIGFNEYQYNNSDEIVLFNPATQVEINRLIYNDLTDAIRKINLFEKVKYKPGNESAKKYLLEKERKKQKRNAKKPYEPYLEKLVVALVNTEEFPYNYETCMDLSIYKFNQSFKQIQHKISFNNTMVGVYAGTVDTSKMSNKDILSWIASK